MTTGIRKAEVEVEYGLLAKTHDSNVITLGVLGTARLQVKQI